jgi:hypothetical protein
VKKKVEGKTYYVEVVEEKVLPTAYTTSTLRSDIVWYLIIGANNHMTEHKYLFVEMTELGGIVLFRDASKVEVEEKGSMKFLLKNKKLGMIEDV